jgi:hypothetical protein
VRLFLGEITLAEALAAAEDKDAIKRQEQICQSMLFGAEFALLGGEKAEVLRLYRETVSSCPIWSIESAAASAALRTLASRP